MIPVPEIFGNENVSDLLAGNGTLVVTAPPGSGKSTLLPLSILNEMEGGKLLMLEPRRLAARQVAMRLAYNLGEKIGETVGYRVRFESCVSDSNRIEVITEGILIRMLQEDPVLDGVSVIVFDEFHERSLAGDEALALVRETRRIVRPDLKIVIMSATIDTVSICSSLGAPLLEGHHKSFPLEIIHAQKDSTAESCTVDVARAVLTACRSQEGDILAFLPGEAEIRRCAELLDGELDRSMIYPLYGMLSLAEQQKAIAPSPPECRKIVIATPVAETSLTIEGVRIVVDSGFCRKLVYDPRNGMSHLETVRISLDMAVQRSGRAARVAPGVCYRLWTPATESKMKACRVPEIMEADLSPLILDSAVWGESDISSLPWITPPPKTAIIQADSLLKLLGALDSEGRITSDGRLMATFPCHPRISRMLALTAVSNADKALAADLAALLEEKDPLPIDTYGVDIWQRLKALRQFRRFGSGANKWGRIIAVAGQYRSLLHIHEDNDELACNRSGYLLAAAFPERVGKSVVNTQGAYVLASGDAVTIDREDEIAANEWIVAAVASVRPGGQGRVFLASEISPEDLHTMAVEYENIGWNSKLGVLEMRLEKRIGRLVLESRQLDDIPKDRAAEIICEAVMKDGAALLDFSDNVKTLQRRVATVSAWHPELELPDLSYENVVKHVKGWLPPFLGTARTRSELKKINLYEAIWSILDYEQQRAVTILVPSHITIPSGKSVALEYRSGLDVPVLSLRLQECFGMMDAPKVDGGKRPVLMELLSPGFKPVQLTSDLRNFWENTYFDVKKELKRRYPKHLWPDDPLEVKNFKK